MKRKELTLLDLVEQFLREQDLKGLSPATVEMEREIISSFRKQYDTVDRRSVDAYISDLKNSDLSLATKNIRLSHIRVFLYWLMEQGLLERFSIRLFKGQQEKIKFYSEEEVKVLLNKPPKDCSFFEHRTYVMICFICSTGARLSTLRNVKLEDLDFSNFTITYTHLKNKSMAIIPMSRSLSKVLTEFLNTWEITDYLFCDKNNQQMSVSAVENALRKYCLKRGVKPRGPHALRHAFARMYIKNGGDAFTLQRILTHSSMEMTKRYVNLFSDDIREPLNNYNPLDRTLRTVTRR